MRYCNVFIFFIVYEFVRCVVLSHYNNIIYASDTDMQYPNTIYEQYDCIMRKELPNKTRKYLLLYPQEKLF